MKIAFNGIIDLEIPGDGVFASWNLIDKITWFVSEAYCMGFVDGTRTVFEAIVMALKEQAAEQGGCNDGE